MKQWKKMLALVVSTLLLISLASGCGKSDVTQQNGGEQTTENTEETSTLPTVTLPGFFLLYEPDREDLPSREQAEQIVQGMTMEEVCQIIGYPQRALDSGGLIPQWDIVSGEKLAVYRERDDSGTWYVTKTELEEPVPVITEEEALEIAEELIGRFQWYKAVGVCCDFTAIYEDMSEYLTAEQKQYYMNYQYRLDCCHTADEVRAHINRVINPDIVSWYPDDFLLTDSEGKLYLIVMPMGAVFYHEIAVTAYDGNQITATAQMMDESGPYGDATFVMDRVDDAFRISDFTQEIW